MISPQEFLLRQPGYPDPNEQSPYYHKLANRLLKDTASHPFATKLPEALLKRIALTLSDYMQDIVSDAGLWRSFVDANRELYGWSVPFHEKGEEYVDYELNREDVRFLVWYMVAMLSDELRLIYPHDKELISFADRCFEILDEEYEEAPVCEEFNIARGLDLNDESDHKAIYNLGNWLFLHSYLLTPAFAMTLQEIISSVDRNSPDATKMINDRLEEAMMEDTTGPLALFIPEWVYLIIERKLPKTPQPAADAKIHPYYEAFTRYTGGKTVQFFDSYEAMNRFFIDALGWAEGEEHLEQAKGADNYVLMVTPYKGMLMARDVAGCLKAPDNPMYDEQYARRNAFELLCERGVCPGDLLKHALKEGWLPDAAFPGTSDRELVHKNADFIARCYLQIYYRGD